MHSRLFERVRQADQGRLTECAARERYPEWRRVHDSASRRNEAGRNHNARVTRLGRRGCATVLWKEDGVKVVIRAFDAIGPVEHRVQTGSGEGQVLSAVGQVAQRIRASGTRVE